VLENLALRQQIEVLQRKGARPRLCASMRQTVQDTIVVQALTGHSSDRMTAHYSWVSQEEKQAALQKVFDKLKSEVAAPLKPAPAESNDGRDADA